MTLIIVALLGGIIASGIVVWRYRDVIEESPEERRIHMLSQSVTTYRRRK